MADGSTNLQILISAVDEASEQLAGIGETLAGLTESAEGAAASMSESLDTINSSAADSESSVDNSSAAMQASFAELASAMSIDSSAISEGTIAVGNSFDQMVAQIAEDASTAQSEVANMSDDTEQSLNGMRSGFLQLGIAAGIPFAALSAATGNAITLADSWAQQSAIVAQILKNIGSSIPVASLQGYAVQLQNSTLFTQQSILQSEGLIVSHKNLADSYKSLTDLSADLATKMNSDLPSATRILTNALADPVAGLNQIIRTGNVDLPPAMVTMIQNMAKMGDISGADKLLLDVLNGSIGGVAEQAYNASSGFDKINQQLNGTNTALGTALIPLTESLARVLDPIITKIGDWMTLHPKLTDAIVLTALAITGLVVAISGFMIFLITLNIGLPVLGTLLATIGATVTAISGPWVALGLVIGLFTALVIADHQKIWDFIKEMLADIDKDWKAMWNGIASFTNTLLNEVGGYFTNLYDTYIKPVLNAISTVGNAIGKGVGAVGNVVGGAVKGTENLIGGLVQAFADGGIVNSPTLALVGEAGPEAIIPLSAFNGGSSLAGGNFGGGGNIIINMTGNFPTDASSVRQIGNLLAQQINTQLRLKRTA